MPASLREDGSKLILRLGGGDFADQLTKAKSVSGRRYNPDDKTWDFPNDLSTLMEVVAKVEPEISTELRDKIKGAKAAIAEELVTQLPDDAILSVPWSGRLASRQRAGVDFLAKHPHSLLADEMGAGKSVQAITAVYERLLRATLQSNELCTDVLQVPQKEAAGAVLQGCSDAAGGSEPVQRVHAQSNEEAPQGRTENTAGGPRQTVCGLRDTAATRMHGPRPHKRSEKVQAGNGTGKPETSSGGNSQVRSAVSELPPPAALPRGQFLVIAPNSVTGHWAKELEKWAGVPATVLSGDVTQRAEQLERREEWVIVNWEKLRIMPELARIEWDAVIADESHRAKNRKAKQTRALWKLRAPVQLALSGTPILNSPDELWPILKWMRPEQYTSYWKFFYEFTEYYDGFKGKPIVVGVKNADRLRFELADKMVRRTKREIHSDIPEPFPPEEREIEMRPKQAKLYDEAVRAFWLEVAQEIPAIADAEQLDESKVRADLVAAVEEGSFDTIKMMIPNAAARAVRLRQIATSPALLGGPDESGKLDAVVETITDAGDRPFVVFAWFKGTVALILERLEAKRISAYGFTGDTAKEDRARLATEFQAEEFQVIVPTIAVGGVGIDLYRASDALLAEQDWVPGINQQAIDRLDRKGQLWPVQAQFFRSAATIETGRIAPKNRTKELIVTTILGA